MVACLLSLGVDANVEGDNGTALQVAEKAGFENVCKILTGTHTHRSSRRLRPRSS